ncbi:MAG: cation/multidrug efflux pump [Gammaproteobacteria bacterium]|nr:MAG: cation/multidrug efflux pump [Gammaproteobacteria bacterium]
MIASNCSFSAGISLISFNHSITAYIYTFDYITESAPNHTTIKHLYLRDMSEIIPGIISKISLDNVLQLPLEVNVIAGLIVFTGLLLAVIAFARLRQKRLLSAGIYSSISTVLLVLAVALIALSMNLYTYNRISHEQDVAEIVFKQLGPQYYSATISLADEHQNTEYMIKGDEWQLDTRIIKWRPPVYLAGLDSLYRLERISGRYRDVEEEKTENRTVYSLTKNEGLDIWSITKHYPSWLPWIDAYYGSATYLPMHDSARFKITLSQTGLLARPVNEAGEESIQFWD